MVSQCSDRLLSQPGESGLNLVSETDTPSHSHSNLTRDSVHLSAVFSTCSTNMCLEYQDPSKDPDPPRHFDR
jgi:hypothetical protein